MVGFSGSTKSSFIKDFVSKNKILDYIILSSDIDKY